MLFKSVSRGGVQHVNCLILYHICVSHWVNYRTILSTYLPHTYTYLSCFVWKLMKFHWILILSKKSSSWKILLILRGERKKAHQIKILSSLSNYRRIVEIFSTKTNCLTPKRVFGNPLISSWLQWFWAFLWQQCFNIY